MTAPAQPATPQVDALLLEFAEVVNTTLDLQTILRRVAELVRRAIDYEIFAILLLNEKTQELRVRFSIGYPPEVAERLRIKVGEGVTGLAAQRREAVLENDVLKAEHYIEAVPRARSELAVPLIIKNRVIGVIDLEAPQPRYFTEDHRRLLSLIGSRIAIGIENARLYTRVARQARTLAVLNEISRDLTSILNVDQLLARAGELLRRLIDYQMFSILLLDPTGTRLEHRFSLKFNESVHIKQDIPVGEGLVGYAALHRQAVLVGDVRKDPRYINTNPETRSELCVPLIYKDKMIGVLDVEHIRRNYFTEEHMAVLTTLSAQVAVAIGNARLYEAVARQEQRLQKDLELARELQLRLLPGSKPKLKHAALAAKFLPARTIGGDLYDFLQYDQYAGRQKDGRVGIAIGDVSGKGAPAAVYAALASGFLRSHAVRRPGAAQMLTLINGSLADRHVEDQYVSMIYALWEDAPRVLRIASSGLPRPMYCHQGQLERVEAVGLPLGMFDHADYDELTYQAHSDDVFVFFSDGIIDAANHTGELFGRGRLEELISENWRRSSDEIVDAIFDAVAAFAAGEDASDDQTVVALKVKGDSGQNP